MINAGIVGMGWWGKTLVEAVSGGQSDEIRFVAGAARTHTDDLKSFAAEHTLELYDSYDQLLRHPQLDAVVPVLACPAGDGADAAGRVPTPAVGRRPHLHHGV